MLRIFAISAIALGASAAETWSGFERAGKAVAEKSNKAVQAHNERVSKAEKSTKAVAERAGKAVQAHNERVSKAEKSTKAAAERTFKAVEKSTKAAAERTAKAVAQAENSAKAAAERTGKAEKSAKAVAQAVVEKSTKAVEKSTKAVAERTGKAENAAKAAAERTAKAAAVAERKAKVVAEQVRKAAAAAEKRAKVRHCVSSWAGWTSCTKKCGSGSQTNTLVIKQRSAFGGTACPTKTFDSRRCNIAPCPVNGGWGAFGAWADCSKSCDGGVTTQIRKCDSPTPAFGGNDCTGSATSTKACNTAVCHCPTCKVSPSGAVQVGHVTEHAKGTHGPRTVHKNCGANGAVGACTPTFVIAHTCKAANGVCKCTCKKPTAGQSRDHHVITQLPNQFDLTNNQRSVTTMAMGEEGSKVKK